MLVTTSNELAGYRIVKQLGVVRGLTVRSRSILGNIGGAFQAFFGGFAFFDFPAWKFPLKCQPVIL